jgi:hypothetical protein
METRPFAYVPRFELSDEELAQHSPASRAFYARDRAAYMRIWNSAVKAERERSIAIFRMQESLGPEFASLAIAMQDNGRYTAADLAKLAGARISARLGNQSAQVKLAEVDASARAEWNRSPVIRTTFRDKFADFHAFRAFCAVNQGSAR